MEIAWYAGKFAEEGSVGGIMYSNEHTITNTTPQEMNVYIEPWALCEVLAPGQNVMVKAISEEEGEWEVCHDAQDIVLFAWGGCTIEIYREGSLIFDCPIACPSVPNNMTTRSFLELVLGKPG
jgi:hypothetical protein